MDLAAVLLADYNYYRRQTRATHIQESDGIPFRPNSLNAKNRKIVDELIVWCREHMIEPRYWIYFLFKVRNWHYQPKLEAGHLQSKKMLEKHQKRKSTGYGLSFFAKRRRATASEEFTDTEAFDPNRDTDPTIERQKKQYLENGQSALCLTATQDTLGYHPQSKTCAACPMAGECAIQLQSMMPFPIISLRAGLITSEEAKRIAHATRHP